MIFAAVSNGRSAGQFTLAPNAKLNDGLLDMMSVPDFSIGDVANVVTEVRNLGQVDTKLVRYQQLEWLEEEASQEIPLTPDGEQMTATSLRFDTLKKRLPFVLPADLPSL